MIKSKINLDLPDTNHLKDHVDSNIRESRDINNNLNFKISSIEVTHNLNNLKYFMPTPRYRSLCVTLMLL